MPTGSLRGTLAAVAGLAGLLGLAGLGVLPGPGAAPARAGEIVFTPVDDGDILTEVSGAETLNEGSTLRRTYLVVNEAQAPVRLERVGIDTRHDADRDRFVLHPEGTLTAVQPVRAVRLVFALFDVFDRPIRTLTLTLVRDLAAGAVVDLATLPGWPASAPEARDLLSVVSHAATVRPAAGPVWSGNTARVHRDMARFGLLARD
ncbi:hypothetical protein [Roseospira goensis]|uniref:Uncharacterized protein n=1 Tax=Roseospira goensis TaxID=391922 RepID=A0A7W6WJT1_9PROT|nr:hypothetical protein [Roseospira goensis]MBB4284822.1 hypothetical protein [Roseospira goensis]